MCQFNILQVGAELCLKYIKLCNMNKRLKNINHWQTHVEPPSELKENKISSKNKGHEGKQFIQ